MYFLFPALKTCKTTTFTCPKWHLCSLPSRDVQLHNKPAHYVSYRFPIIKSCTTTRNTCPKWPNCFLPFRAAVQIHQGPGPRCHICALPFRAVQQQPGTVIFVPCSPELCKYRALPIASYLFPALKSCTATAGPFPCHFCSLALTKEHCPKCHLD